VKEETIDRYSGDSEADALLQRQAAMEFSRALRRGESAAVSGKPELAVGWCRYAASLAWAANPGFFYSHEIEQLLAEIGRKHLGAGSSQPSTPGLPRRFLHVMSSAFETGGSTPALSRWIETCAQHAPSELHSILISMQNDMPVPACLSDAARRTGGTIIELPSGLSWLQAAAQIRSRSLEFDAVVLNIYPNDPLPNLALHDQPRPVLFFRHSEHAFNLGLDVARVLADLRSVGNEMSVRFGPKAPRKVRLPLPLNDEALTPGGKVDARRKLGLPVDALIVLTIGWPYKFVPRWGYSFASVVQSLCEANSRVHIVAVGLTESEPFPGLGQSTGGRFLPVGVVEDREILELFYRAADIYLDAYPCSSLTALLDAARHGIPVQRLYNRHLCLLWGEDPGLDSVMRGASTQDEFIQTVLEWLEWPEEKRLELGSRFRKALLQDHCGASWKNKWLDPAIDAMASPGKDLPDSRTAQGEYLEFPGLGKAWREVNWPADMFVAGAILGTDRIPRSIRTSGLFRSIRPALFGAAGNGTRRQRLFMFGLLFASLMPSRIRTTMRWIWRAVFARRSSK